MFSFEEEREVDGANNPRAYRGSSGDGLNGAGMLACEALSILEWSKPAEVGGDGRSESDDELGLIACRGAALEHVSTTPGGEAPRLVDNLVEWWGQKRAVVFEPVAQRSLRVAGHVSGDAFEGRHCVLNGAG